MNTHRTLTFLTALRLATTAGLVGAQTKALAKPGLDSVAPQRSLAQNEIKAAPAGLVCFGFPPRGWETIFNCTIHKLKWEELEPEEGHYEAGFRKLDETFQRAGTKGLSVHLLVVCGADSPTWLKKKIGTVTVFDPGGLAYNPHAKGGRTCARWWDPEFGKAYARMQQVLAERYDAHPQLAAVGMNRCMSFWPEPFMRQLRDVQNRRNLREAGYSAALDKAAHEIWRVENKDISVKFGEWFTVEIFLEPGPAGTGRFLYRINGQTVFSVADRDLQYKNSPLHTFEIFKLYQDSTIIDWMRKHGTPCQAWYDDLEYWDDMPKTP